jgi:hypothetical protein
MRRSYKVQLSDGINFKNDRDPHVQTPEENLTGKTFILGTRREKRIGSNIAIMYDIVGVSDGKYPAHITTYFGSPDESKNY